MSDDAHRIKYLSLAVVAMEAHDPTAPLTRVVRAVLGLNEARSDGERQLLIVALRSALDEMGQPKNQYGFEVTFPTLPHSPSLRVQSAHA